LILSRLRTCCRKLSCLFAGGSPEIVAQDFLALLNLVAFLIDDGDAGFLAEWGIGQHHVVVDGGLGDEGVGAGGDVLLVAEAVEEEVHGAEPRGGGDEFDGVECVGFEVALLRAVEFVGLENVGGGGEKESAGSGRGINDCGAGLRAHDLDDGIDQDARGEVLAGAGLGVLGVLFEQAFVDIALDGPR